MYYELCKSALKKSLVDIYFGDPEGCVEDPRVDDSDIREWVSYLPAGNDDRFCIIATRSLITEMLEMITDPRSILFQGSDFIITHQDLVDISTDMAARICARMQRITHRQIEYVIMDNFDTAFRFSRKWCSMENSAITKALINRRGIATAMLASAASISESRS